MKNISIIGSTGSIGTQALDVVREGDFAVCALAAGRNAALLEQQARAVRPQYAVLADEKEAKKLKTALADTSVRVMGGEDEMCIRDRCTTGTVRAKRCWSITASAFHRPLITVR